ncbi:MAG TPA: A24 family peptidase, partial [Acidobacteriaceae bacterium]|nr:A24 family peptidase [Acidobacteriaceae bacterium]
MPPGCGISSSTTTHRGPSGRTNSASGVELTDPSQTQLIYAAIAAVCACLACVFDIRDRRIPNRLTGPVLFLGIAAHACLSGWKGLADAMVAACLGGLVFLLFHFAGGMGAGDVKLMAATAAVVGSPSLGILLISTGLAGGLLALGMSVARGVLRQTMANVLAVAVHHHSNGLSPH